VTIFDYLIKDECVVKLGDIAFYNQVTNVRILLFTFFKLETTKTKEEYKGCYQVIFLTVLKLMKKASEIKEEFLESSL